MTRISYSEVSEEDEMDHSSSSVPVKQDDAKSFSNMNDDDSGMVSNTDTMNTSDMPTKPSSEIEDKKIPVTPKASELNQSYEAILKSSEPVVTNDADVTIFDTPKSLPRRSRWDVVESQNVDSPRTSPVKTSVVTADPIILDYKRDKNMCMKLSFGAPESQQQRLNFDQLEFSSSTHMVEQSKQLKSNYLHEDHDEFKIEQHYMNASGQKEKEASSNSIPAKRKVFFHNI